MEPSNGNSQFNQILSDVLGLDETDSLVGNDNQVDEEFDGACGDGADDYLHSDDENLQNLPQEELNNEASQDESLSFSDGEEFDLDDEEVEIHNDNFTDQEFIEGPVIGMTFVSVESLFTFYKEHSRLIGFGVVKKSSKKRGTEYARYVSFACYKSRKCTARTTSKRVDCKAKVNCSVLPDGSCKVTKFVAEHNHELEPSLSRFLRCHRQLSRTLKRRLEAHDIARLKPSKSIRLLEVEAGGPDRIGCTPKDCRNFIIQQRRMRTLSSDAAAIQKFFYDMQTKDDEFFYAIDTDHSARLRNVVWVHTHCKYAYREFSDVVCFDTTYLVNQWRMPFASFIGINQHKQSILLGCALLTSEDTETYKFVFSSWLAAMGNAPPTAILTDQCESIKGAIREVLPDTIHRYCIWHIMTKLPLRLKGVWDFKAAKAEFKSIIFNSITIAEFDAKWDEFIQKYELQERQWFRNLHSERENWVLVFLKHYFWAGMMSTQRCESMHAFFDGYINGRSSLKQFVEQYEIALRFKYEKELQAEADSRKTHSPPFSGFDWEMQIQTHYSRSIYDVFLNEHIRRFIHCELADHPDSGTVEGVEKFSITDFSIRNDFHGNSFVYTVDYRPANQYLECNCKNFESEGVVCCHILKVMSHRRIDKLHERNCDIVLDNNVKYMDFKNVLKGRFIAYSDWNDDMAVPSVGDAVSDDDVIFIRNPRKFRTRGRPQMNRNRSARGNIFRRGGGRWNTSYYDAAEEGESNRGRRGGGRRGGRRRGGRCNRGVGDRGGRTDVGSFDVVYNPTLE